MKKRNKHYFKCKKEKRKKKKNRERVDVKQWGKEYGAKWLMSQKFMVVTAQRSSFTQRRRYAFITIIDDET